MLKKILVLSVAALLCFCSSLYANESIGSVKSVSGSAEIVRGEQVIPVILTGCPAKRSPWPVA